MHFDRDLGEKQGQEGKDSRLDEPDKDLESEKGHGENERHKKHGNKDQHLARENIPEETEGEGDDPRELRDKLHHTDKKRHRCRSSDELRAILHNAYCCNAKKLNREKGNECEGECKVKIGRRGVKEWDAFSKRQEAEPVLKEYEEKDRHHDRIDALRDSVILQGLAHKAIRVGDHGLNDRLVARRLEGESAAREPCGEDKEK